MFFIAILEKIKEANLRSVRVLTLKMANYEEARVKQTNTQLKKLKSASKYKIETTL